MQSPKSPSTPMIKSHIHGNDKKQDLIDDLTLQEVERVGSSNYIQASYFRYLCVATIGNQNPKLESLQPNISINQDSPAWNQALKLCLAFLRRRKMDQTLSAIRHEYLDCPKSTGYSHASEVDIKMDQLLGLTPSTPNYSTHETGNINDIPFTPK